MHRCPDPLGVLALASLLALGLPPALAAEHSDLDLAFEPTTSTVQGTALITFEEDEVQDGAFLLLYDNLLSRRNPRDNALQEDLQYARGFSPGSTRVTAVTDGDGRDVPFAAAASPLLANLVTYPVDDFLLRLDLPPAPPGAVRRLTVSFRTRVPPLLSGDSTSLRGSFVHRFLWFPKLARTGGGLSIESFTYTMRIRVPEGYQVISAGSERQEGAVWQIDSGGTPRAGIPLAIVRAGTLEQASIRAADRTLRVFAKPAHLPLARRCLRFLAESLARYEPALGPLDEGPITIVEGGAAGMWGMTGDMFILLGTDAFNADLVLPGLLDRVLDFLVSHEAAHLWFGIGAGTDFVSENWLSESLAQYASVAWMEEKYGPLENYFNLPRGAAGDALRILLPWNSFRDSMADSILGLRKSGLDFPLLAPPRGQNQNGYASVLYDRGAMAVRQLRLEAGPESFDEALRAYCMRYRRSTGGTREFLAVLEKWSPGITAVARRILETTAAPEYAVARIEQAGSRSVISFVDRAASGLSSEAVIVTDAESTTVRLSGTGQVEVEGAVRSVSIDPSWTTLDSDRRNNSWPRRLNFPLPTGSPFDADTLAPAFGLQAASSGGSTLLGVSVGMRYRTEGTTSVSAEAGVLPLVALGTSGVSAQVQGYADVDVGLPRSLNLGATFVSAGDAWQAGLGLAHTIWLRRDAGTPSPLFIPGISWGLSAAVDQDGQIMPSVSLDVEGLHARVPFLLRLGAAGSLAPASGTPFDWLSLQAACRVQAEASAFLRPLPRFYAVPVLDAALAFPAPGAGIVPGRLRAGDSSTGDGRAYAGLDLLFPIANGLEVPLANLAILRSVFAGVYAEAEDVFTGLPTLLVLSPSLWEMRAGIQAGVLLTTLGGAALPLAAGVDLAVSRIAWGTESWAEGLRFFFSAHVPTLFYGTTVTW
jgi:hypothetical protein